MTIRIGVVGAGYWGPNLIRNVVQTPGAVLHSVCDLDAPRLARIQELYPSTRTTSDFAALIDDDEVDALIVATPAHTHYALGRQALEAGKHVLIEKPLALESLHAQELVSVADANQCVLMVGHTFMYNSAVNKIKTLIDAGEIGDVYYIYSNRVNLGRVRKDINALWNIAPHDISIMTYLLGQVPVQVSAQGRIFLQPDIEDVVFVTLAFPDNIIGHVQVSWLDPSKVRRMTVVGSTKMIVYDDVASEGKVKIYDKGILKVGQDNIFGEYQVKLHSGDIHIPKIDMSEPLRNECTHFVECIRTGARPLTDGRNGLEIVQILEAAQHSLKHNGTPVDLVDRLQKTPW